MSNITLSQVLDGAENSNAAAEAELWNRFRAVRPLDALMLTDHHQQNRAAIEWAREQIARRDAA